MTKNKTSPFSFVEKIKNFLYGDKSRPYEKPRRIIQNQTLIVLLFLLAVGSPVWLGTPIFYLIFGACSSIVVPCLVAVWIVGSVSYIVMRLHVERQNKKS
ncbi:MAG: hypothetical protein OEZ18_00640 [Candidatus Bathyarchaeota archaeon]|nr:hypothetical protein [Candidatus Bathyarchaeota archaeon]